MQPKLMAVLIGCCSISSALLAVTYRVAPVAAGGDDAHSGLDWSAPMATISNAMAQADVTEILVSNGTYNLMATVTNNKAVVIRSYNAGAVDRAGTMIDAGGARRCLLLDHAEAVVDGLTITGGYVSNSAAGYGRGAGVYIEAGGGMLTNCLLTGNFLMARAEDDGGGGVCMLGGALWNCRIAGNTVTNAGTDYRQCGGGILILNSGLVAQCEIDGNYMSGISRGGGGVALRMGGVVMHCGISNNFSRTVGGGGVYISQGGLVTGCVIAANTAQGSGGGLYTYGSSDAIIPVDCVISNNTCTAYGGGAYINASNTLSGGQVVNNRSGSHGGGVAVQGGRMDGVLVAANAATGSAANAGGIYMLASADNYVRNTIVSNNTSAYDAGGVYLLGGVLDACEIVTNVCNGANAGGGGLYVIASADAWVLNSTVRCNYAKSSSSFGGGGVFLYRMYNGYMDNCLIEGNAVATGYGGGMYIRTNSIVRNCRILGNTTVSASRYGGGVYFHPDANGAVLQNCLVAGNTAQYFCAAGIYALSNFNGMISACTIVDNEVRSATAGRRGAGLYIAGSNNIYNSIICSNRWVTPPPDDWDIDVGFGGDAAAASNACHYCLVPRDLPPAQGNINGAAIFTDNAWHQLSGSPGINAGTNQPWMLEPGAVDLDGWPRLDHFSRLADMGCYEHVFNGAMFNIR